MLAKTPARGHPAERTASEVYAEPSPRWVRVEFNDTYIANSKRPLLVWDTRGIPLYYFPREDVRMDLLEESDKVATFPGQGKTVHWNVVVGERTAENAARAHPEPPENVPELAEYITFQWSAMDAWYEEEERIHVHPRDPYKRVDIRPSSRHVKVELDGVTLAESDRPYLLFETGLPTRYYLPPEDVRTELLEPSDKHTRCPYKGKASYYSLHLNDEVYEDFVWTYPDPLPESPQIEGLLCFYNERVDLTVDGELLARPETHWS